MHDILDNLFDTSAYDSLLEKDRAYTIYGVNMALLILGIVFMTITRDERGYNLWHLMPGSLPLTFYVIFFYATVAATYWFARQGRASLAGYGLLLAWAGGLLFPVAQLGFYQFTDGIGLVTLMLMAALVLGYRGLALGTAATVALAALGIISRTTVLPPTAYDNSATFVNLLMSLSLLVVVIAMFLRYATLSRAQGAQSVTTDRLRLAEITSQVAQRISRRMALQAVLTSAVEQIRAEYPLIYHAQIFLLDESRATARLVASTGDVGRMLMERRHSLPVGSLSVIGQVTAQNQTVIARAGSSDGIHRRNEFLPDTAVEAAFPLRIGDQVIGALDLQSKVATAFRQEDITIFQSLADHIAIAIDNARLFEETEQRLQENRRLVEQTRRAAGEVERLNQQLTRRFWLDYLGSRAESLGVTVDFASSTAMPVSDWTPGLQAAVEANQLVQHPRDNNLLVVAAPLRVRGQVIGAMEFELDASSPLTPEDLTLIQEVGERLGLAAETSRLFEASQSAAQREALVNEIAARLQATSSVEMTLNTAARSLKETMKASRVAIRLGTPPGDKNSVREDNQS